MSFLFLDWLQTLCLCVFSLKMLFKVDSSTVGSLLDDTNARNWRDALLQVWMISPKIDNQSFPFLYGAPQPCDGTPSPIQSQSNILKDLVLLMIVFSRLQSKTTLEKRSWPPRHRHRRRLRKSRTLLRLDSNIIIIAIYSGMPKKS